MRGLSAWTRITYDAKIDHTVVSLDGIRRCGKGDWRRQRACPDIRYALGFVAFDAASRHVGDRVKLKGQCVGKYAGIWRGR